MTGQQTHRNQNGFTLLELMIVMVIIGILAALAIPRFLTASTRAKQSEAGEILKQIYTMEFVYKKAAGTFGDDGINIMSADPSVPGSGGGTFPEIGAEVQVNNRYQYDINAGATTFTATATANLDDDATDDVWTIDQTGNLQCTSNDAIS